MNRWLQIHLLRIMINYRRVNGMPYDDIIAEIEELLKDE